MVTRRSRAAPPPSIVAAAGALLLAAACGSGAGLGERFGAFGRGTIACADGFYCSLPSSEATGSCRRAGRTSEPCPEPTLASCATGLTCNRAFNPPACTPPIAQGMDCANADCASGLICLVKPVGPPICDHRRLKDEGCLNAYDQCAAGLTCLPYADVPEGGVCGSPVPAGNVCDDVDDCQSGLTCNDGFTPARCEPLSEVGQPCGRIQDCRSLNCDLVARTCRATAAAPID
jgi:hypothetical protein